MHKMNTTNNDHHRHHQQLLSVNATSRPGLSHGEQVLEHLTRASSATDMDGAAHGLPRRGLCAAYARPVSCLSGLRVWHFLL